MSITFRQLEVFVAAAKDCNFRHTADRLDITQPSVSGHIRSLEGYLGHSLFDRRRGVAPTLSTEGQWFLRKAQELLTSRAVVGDGWNSARGAGTVNLTIMVGPLLLDAGIRPILPGFCVDYPRIALQIVPLHPTRSAVQLLNSGDIDFALFTGDSTHDESVLAESIGTVGCSIYAAPALARRLGRLESGLEQLPWVMPPESFAPARFMWRFLRSVDVEPRNIIARSQFADVAASMVLDGHGVSVLFDDFASQGLADGRIVRVGPALPGVSRLLLIGRRARHAACEPVVRLLRQALRTPLGATWGWQRGRDMN